MPAKKMRSVRKDAKAIEAKHIGEETIDWSSIKEEDVMNTVMTNLRHYGYFYDQKSYIDWVELWIKENRDAETLKQYKRAAAWRTSSTFAGLCRMELNGATLPLSSKEYQLDQLDRILASALEDNVIVIEDKKPAPRKNPAELLEEKTSVILGEIEGNIDAFVSGELSKSYSLYTQLKRQNVATQSARQIIKALAANKLEIDELVSNKSPDLNEAYAHITKRKQKQYQKFLEDMISDTEKYLEGKKATRRPRTVKEKPLSKQVEKVQYLKESTEYKVTSINPIQILGKQELYLFNSKTRVLKYIVTDRRDGLYIKGTTVQGFDTKLSFKKKIRKPEELFSSFMKTTKSKALKYVKGLRTTESEIDGRINKDTIILKVF